MHVFLLLLLASAVVILASFSQATQVVIACGSNAYGQINYGSTLSSSTFIIDSSITNEKIIQISSAYNSNLLLTENGTVFAWGRNNYGQLGDGTTTDRSTPIQISNTNWPSKHISKVSSGGVHSMALSSVGDVYTWGDNSKGQLGDGSNTPTNAISIVSSLVSLVPATVAIDIAAGYYYSMVLMSDGSVVGWGTNDHSEISQDPLAVTDAPQVIVSVSNGYFLAAGYGRTYLVTSDDISSTYSWGVVDGQIIDGVNDFSLPSLVDPSGFDNLNLRQIAVGKDHTLALSADGSAVFAWGKNTHGQLGDGTTTDSSLPIKIPASSFQNKKIAKIAAHRHSLAVSTDGVVFAWGYNADSQLCNGGTANVLTPTVIFNDPSKPIVDVAAGSSHTIAYTGLLCAGIGGCLNAGNCTGINSCTCPSSYTGINCAIPKCFGIEATNHLVCSISSGACTNVDTCQCYAGYSGDRCQFYNCTNCNTEPQAVQPTMTGVQAVFSAGGNSDGQLGVGSFSPGYYVGLADVVNTQWSSKSITTIVCGWHHNLALASDGSLYAWGKNPNGELGDGTRVNKPTPIPVNGSLWSDTSIKQVAAGGSFSIVLTEDGRVFTWGSNQYGVIGDASVPVGIQGFRTSASQISPSSFSNKTIIRVRAGAHHAMALSNDGIIFVWGMNEHGEAGDGTITHRSTPTPVKRSYLDNLKIVEIFAGYFSSFALTENGTVYAWGNNQNKQLGMPSSTNYVSIPFKVTSFGKPIALISGGNDHSLALATDGTLFAVGKNNYGQLGDGTVIARNSPIVLSSSNFGGRNISQIGAASLHSVVLTTDGYLYSWGTNSGGQLISSCGRSGGIPYICPSVTDATLNTVKKAYRVSVGYTHTVVLAEKFSCSGIGGCGSYGSCTGTNQCTCDSGYYGSTCSIPSCGGIPANESTVCSGHGSCNSLNSCSCHTGYSGVSCQVPMCYSKLATDSAVCAYGNGICVAPDTCQCSSEYKGTQCELYNCTTCTDDPGSFQVLSFGDNSNGQGGVISDSSINIRTISNTYWKGKTITKLASGETHSMALASDGAVFTWGSNQNGVLGLGDTTLRRFPRQIDDNYWNGMTITSIYASGYNSAALTSNGTVFIWGDNSFSQVSTDTLTSLITTPVMFSSSSFDNQAITTLALGQQHILALAADGRVFAWGYNDYGQTGDGTGTTSYPSVPVAIPTLPPGITKIAAGIFHSLALASDGAIYVWGDDSYALGGIGQASDPTSLGNTFCNGKAAVDIAAGDYHSMAINVDGELCAFGNNANGELGDGSISTQPYAVVADASFMGNLTATKIYHSYNHRLATMSDGSIFSWGAGGYGQLGNVGNSDVNFPSPAIGLQSYRIVEVATGYQSSLALSVPTCHGVSSTNVSVCTNQNGWCVAMDTCQCKAGYVGDQCQIATCFGVFGNDSSVCGGVGACTAPDTCTCSTPTQIVQTEYGYIENGPNNFCISGTTHYLSKNISSAVYLNDSSSYQVINDITIQNGATLTVPAGTTLFMHTGIDITVHGTFVAQGNDTAWISIKSASNAGWGSILLEKDSTGSVLKYVSLENGGLNSVAFVQVKTTCVVDNIQIKDWKSSAWGIYTCEALWSAGRIQVSGTFVHSLIVSSVLCEH